MADNHFTLDSAVMVASIMAVYNINFDRCIIAKIHERTFWKDTTMSFSCLIHGLCRDSGVPIIPGADKLIEATRTKDVKLIKDDTNPIAQKRASQPEVVLSELFEGPAAAPAENASILDSDAPTTESSMAPATTFTPPPTSIPHPKSVSVVTISVKVLQKLVQRQTQTEAQLAQLIKQLKPWVRKTIADFEERAAVKLQKVLDERDWLVHS